jgi:hypothetical protein
MTPYEAVQIGTLVMSTAAVALHFVLVPKKVFMTHKFTVGPETVQHGPERECAVCGLKVNRYVPSSTGAAVKCVNCIAERR